MKISILTIGDELLKGSTINTNAAFLGEALQSCGQTPQINITVPDKPDAIIGAIDHLLNQSDLIITGGGLGSTGDDLTRDAIAARFGLELRQDAEIAARLREYAQKNQSPCAEKILKQALLPAGGEALRNSTGTAPGIWLKLPGFDAKYLCMLPGPPREQRPMITDELLPRLAKIITERGYTKMLRIVSASELQVETVTEEILNGCGKITPAYCASFEQVKLFLNSTDEVLLKKKAKEMEKAFGTRIMHHATLAEEVIALLRKHHMYMATAESCTGGMIAAAMTDIAGSSDVFRGGVVAYSNEIKHDMLGVTSQVLDTYGAVSGQCVSSMVENLCIKFHAEAGVAVSGIAGPGGATPDKPVGLVYIAAKLGQKAVIRECHFSGNREAVRQRTVFAALFELREMLLEI